VILYSSFFGFTPENEYKKLFGIVELDEGTQPSSGMLLYGGGQGGETEAQEGLNDLLKATQPESASSTPVLFHGATHCLLFRSFQ
jgi:hypothetical protein